MRPHNVPLQPPTITGDGDATASGAAAERLIR
jgi:hypothetical protein